MPNKYFPVDGVATHVFHRGPTTLPDVAPDLSRGETLIALHDRGGNSAVFDPLADALAARHSPLAFDWPGHGRSGGLDSLGSIERMAEFAAALAGKLGIERAVWVGHGMGAAAAIELALTRKDLTRALVLCSGAPSHPDLDAQVEQLRCVTLGRERRPFDRGLYAKQTPREVVQRGFMEGLKTDPRAGYGDLLACRDWSAEGRLDGVAVPTLVVIGDEAPPALVAGCERLADEIPGARRVSIPGAGHMLPLEQPAALCDALCAFLSEIGS